MLSAKQGGNKYNFLSLWYDSTTKFSKRCDSNWYYHSRSEKTYCNSNEGMTSHSPDLQNRSLTIKYSLKSYQEHLFLWGGVLPILQITESVFFQLLWQGRIEDESAPG